MTRVGPRDATDVHGVEVRPRLVLVFHHAGVPVEEALAAVRQELGHRYELLPVRTDALTIPLIDEAMARHDDSDGPSITIVPLSGDGESN